MFCERCGCVLKDGELTCPECGAYYGSTEVREPPKKIYLYVSFVVTTAAMATATFFFGYYTLFFVLLFWIGGRPQSNKGMVLRGIALGVTAGCAIGLTGRLLSGIL